MRFFHHTPMAIATVDREGGIVRTNPLFARLFHNLLRRAHGEGAGRSISAIVAERDRPALDTAIAEAAQGKGDITPVDAALAGAGVAAAGGERFARFYVTAVEEEERDQEAAIVYVLETTEQRELETKVTQTQKMERRAANADLTGRGTILLVEDEDGLRALNARGLASRGYTVLEAGNGVEAIDVLEKADGQVDLVVSDVVMPEMDGPTLLRELRNRNPSLKIIFVSGYAEDAFQKHLPEHGQFAFLPKPFTLKQLVTAVKDTLAA